MVGVGYCFGLCTPRASKNVTLPWCRVYQFMCTHGYMIRDSNQALRLLQSGNKYGSQVADKHMWRIHKSYLRVYALYPFAKILMQDREVFNSLIAKYNAKDKTIEDNRKVQIYTNASDDLVKEIVKSHEYPVPSTNWKKYFKMSGTK